MSTNNNTTNQNIKGMVPITTPAMVGSNPYDSARQAGLNQRQSQANANSAMAGGKMNRRRRYIGGAIIVPQSSYQNLYTNQTGTGTDPNSQYASGLQTSTQMAANSQWDNEAKNVKGGSRRRKGGNPDWVWGCMSGGKKGKSKRRTRRHKHKKSRKSRTYRKY